ncbi:STAS domain-containing protein [Streptomyces sp. NPDC006733]|uniref:STAS domain-containing protein n=1 Tax=Streptomyces sp. NPDC006733 TaxID=3155460 RepID=UPI0033CC1AB0
MTDRPLTATRHTHPRGATVLTVTGDLDHYTAPELTGLLLETPFGADVPVLIDVSGLTYCDSTGITVFISADRRAQEAGARLVLVGLSADLMHVFRMIGLDQVFTFESTIEDAVGPREA